MKQTSFQCSEPNRSSLDFEKMTDYDDATAFLGQWGRFQQIAFFLICATIIPNGLIGMCVVFVAAIPDHHCLIPEVNLTQPWLNATIPKEVKKFMMV